MRDFFRDIPVFVEVGRQKSLSRAADILDMPLSTLSRRVAALEKNLGFSLFLRGARKIEFTGNGRLLFEKPKRIVVEIEEVRNELMEVNGEPRGPVRFSARPTFTRII